MKNEELINKINDDDLLKIHLLSSNYICKNGHTLENYNKIVQAINLLDCIDLSPINEIIKEYYAMKKNDINIQKDVYEYEFGNIKILHQPTTNIMLLKDTITGKESLPTGEAIIFLKKIFKIQ